MDRFVYAFTDVAANGETVTEYVRFSQRLTPAHIDILGEKLVLVKHAERTNKLDTAGIITAALDKFKAITGVSGHLTDSPVVANIKF